MVDDREERTFEIVKLRVAFLQHIITLSGAAILIILALIERAETTKAAWQLAAAVPLFVIAALVSVNGVVWLLVIVPMLLVDRARESQGLFSTALAAASFSAGVVGAALSALGVPARILVTVTYAFGVLMVGVATALLLWVRRARGRR